MINATHPYGRHESLGLTRQARLLVALAGGSPAQRASVENVLAQVPEVKAEFVELAESQAAKDLPEIALLAVLLDPAHQQKWPTVLCRPFSNTHKPMVIGLLADRSSELIRAALRAGADDVLSVPPTADEALGALLRAMELRRRGEKPSEDAICSLVSVCGGRGVSHLTVNLGIAVRRLLDKRTVLVDLDLQAAPLSVLLDIEPEHSISQLADPTSPIDSLRLDSVLSKHDSGLALLAAPKLIEEAELVSAATIETALKVLHDLFNIVLVDCGSHLNESSVVVFENSDHLLYVLDQSVTAVRAAQRFLSLRERLGLREVPPKLIVNRYQGDHPITLEQIEGALNLPVFATVPRDDAAFMELQVSGQGLWKISSGSGVRDSVENLTRKLFAAGEAAAAGRPGLFSRLLAGLRH